MDSAPEKALDWLPLVETFTKDKDVLKPQGGADAADVARNVHEQMERLDKGYAAREAAAGVNISQGASDRMMSRARQRTQQQPEGASENPYEIEAPPAVRPHSVSRRISKSSGLACLDVG